MSDPVTDQEHEQVSVTLAMANDNEDLVSTACPECATRFALLVRQEFKAKKFGTHSLSGSNLKVSGWMVNMLRCVACGWSGQGELKA